MGRPVGSGRLYEQICFRLPESLRKKVLRIAEAKGITESDFVRVVMQSEIAIRKNKQKAA